MFATAKKFVIIPAMIGFSAAIVVANPAMAESMEDTETPMAANCLPLAMEKTGECIPLPTISIRRTSAPDTDNVEVVTDADELDTESQELAEQPQPTRRASIEELNTPEALSQIPTLPAITSNIAEVPEDIDLVAQDFE